MAKVILKQVRSKIGSTKRQKLTLDALKLRRINSTVEVEATPQIMGMFRKVSHLVTIIKE